MKTLILATFAGLENLVNKALQYDPNARQQLSALAGQVFNIQVLQTDLEFWLRIEDDQIVFMTHWENEPDAAITGTLANLVSVIRHEDKTQGLMEYNVKVAGHSQSLTKLQHIADQLNIDWEAALADVVGDLPGHLLADGVRQVHGFAQSVLGNLSRSSRNFIREESDWFAHPAVTEEFANDLSQLRLQTDRLEARIRRLSQRLSMPEENAR